MMALGGFLLASCESTQKKVGALYEGPNVIVNNLEIKYSENGLMKVQLKTPKSLEFQNNNKIFPDTVNINFYNPEGAVITRLRSDSGRYSKSEDVFIVKGNVRVVKSETNEILTTSELRWSAGTQKVFTDKPLVVRNKITREVTNAIGMDADQDFTHIKFRKATGIYKFIGP